MLCSNTLHKSGCIQASIEIRQNIVNLPHLPFLIVKITQLGHVRVYGLSCAAQQRCGQYSSHRQPTFVQLAVPSAMPQIVWWSAEMWSTELSYRCFFYLTSLISLSKFYKDSREYPLPLRTLLHKSHR